MSIRNEGIDSILIFDTSLESPNLGDQIIMESVDRVVESVFPKAPVNRIPTHRFPRRSERRLMREAPLRIVGGTNLLSSNMDVYRQWQLRDRDVRLARGSVLLGVGWWQYQEPPNRFTIELLHELLDSDWLHSVRDSYTKHMLHTAGFTNVVNTGCPTLWTLTPEHCSKIPTQQASAVVATLTDYNKHPDDDALLLRKLDESYRRVYLWGQSKKDIEYARELLDNVIPIGPSLGAYDNVLRTMDIDYVGTRLHAGIRAIEFRKRALIVSVDNRATEMAKDFRLNTIERSDLHELPYIIRAPLVTSIGVPRDAIEDWKQQFQAGG